MVDCLRLQPITAVGPQRDYYLSKARFIAADCGRRSGKTLLAKRRMLRALLSQHPINDNPLYLWGLPTYDQAKNTAWYDFLRIFEPIKDIIKVRDLTIEIPTGIRASTGEKTSSKLLVRGMMNPFRVEGVGYCGVVLDEMSDMPPSAYERTVLPAIKDKSCRGWVMLIGVPKLSGIGGAFFKEKCEQWGSDPDPKYARFSWASDIILDEAELTDAKKQMDPKTYREQFQASWENANGLAYYGFNRAKHVTADAEYNPNERLIIASDFNVSPMSWCVIQGDDRLTRVIDELSISDTNTRYTLDELSRRYGAHKAGFEFYGDSAGKQRHTSASESDYIQIKNDKRFADSFGRVHVFYSNRNPAVFDRIASVNTRLENAAGEVRMQINPRCKELIKDFENIVFRSSTCEIDKSDSQRTHMSDALGYYIHYRYPLEIERKKGTADFAKRTFH